MVSFFMTPWFALILSAIFLTVLIIAISAVLYSKYSCKCQLSRPLRKDSQSDRKVFFADSLHTSDNSKVSTLEREFVVPFEPTTELFPQSGDDANVPRLVINEEDLAVPPNSRVTNLDSATFDDQSVNHSIISIGSCLTLGSQNSVATFYNNKDRSPSLNNILEDSESIMSFRQEMINLRNSNILTIYPDEQEAMKSYYSQFDEVFASTANEKL
ncbi:uncharacterized protein LOC142340006 [Convolutriloba macropyga]|uniref:uncharacterized protein LOC142340006 n=1 Tax=Convolutriloba macropyga TaxID=536237 RepID=UPI003F51AF71